jgi:hypothetical protein
MRALFLAFLMAMTTSASRIRASAPPPFIVHEWGTFTSVVGENGLPMEWQPFDEPSHLPSFVYAACASGCDVAHPPEGNRIKPTLRALVRLETPVVYFYSPAPITVSAGVSFPEGRLTEWFPQARSTASRLDWPRVAVRPAATADLVDEGGPRVYYAARATDAADVRVEGADGVQNERFLFYRGVGRVAPPAWITADGESVSVSDARGQPIAEVVLFENHGGRIGYKLQRKSGPGLTLNRHGLTGTMDELRADLVKMLVRAGLYEKEAAAMVETWGDSWFEEGTRVFYVVPESITAAALPLQIEPRPSQLVRVLVARTEILTADRLSVLAVRLRTLTDAEVSDATSRQRTRQELGRFGEPTLRRLLEVTREPGVRHRIEKLLARPAA